MNDSTQSGGTIAYLGPSGAGFGFRMAGIEVVECSDGEDMVRTLRGLVQAGEHRIIFIDEGFAKQHLDVIQRLNKNPLPAIILLPNPANPQNIASQNMQKLMVRAIGSDIFG